MQQQQSATKFPTTPEHRAHVLEIRQRKREQALAIGLDEALVGRIVEHFYARIRTDEQLGPIFAERIADWPTHLARMKQFWGAILFGDTRFSGNPMVRHQQIPGLTHEHFSHWLTLFYRTLREECPQPAGVAFMAEKARMIAESLLLGIQLQRDGITSREATRRLPHA